MAVLGDVSLRHWQASAELLFREQARDMAAMAVDKIEMTLRETENGSGRRAAGRAGGAGAARRPLDAFLAAHPLVRRLYLFDRRGELLYPATRDESDAASSPASSPRSPRGSGSAAGGGADGRRSDRPGRHPARTRMAAPLLATLDLEPRGAVRGHPGPDRPDPRGADHPGRPRRARSAVFSKESLAGADRVLTVPFRERLATWRLAVYQPPGDSPRQAVRRQVMLFMCAFGVLLVVIAAGTVLTWRLTRREAEMAQLKSDFVANVSHDLKTPLSVIRMFGETLEMGRVTDEARRQEYYGVIARESERLSRLIENVLDFARIEGGRRTYSIVPTAVEPVIRDTLEAFSHPLASEGFKVDVRVPPDLPEVPMDGEAIAQALSNLVDNAIKYSAERKSLAVEARLADGELALVVADTRCGDSARGAGPDLREVLPGGAQRDPGPARAAAWAWPSSATSRRPTGGRVTVESTPGRGQPLHRCGSPRAEPCRAS